MQKLIPDFRRLVTTLLAFIPGRWIALFFRGMIPSMKATQPRCLNLCVTAILVVALKLPAADTTVSQPASAWEQSVTLEQQGDYKGALAKLNDFASQSGDPYMAQLRSGWLSYRQASYEQAAQYYQTASLLAPEAVSPQLGLAYSARMLGQTQRAATACLKVLSIDPQNYSASMMLAGIYFERRNYSGASQLYAAMEKAYPEDATALSAGSWTLLDMGNRNDAAAGFRRLLQMYPSYLYASQGYQMSGGAKLFQGGIQ